MFSDKRVTKEYSQTKGGIYYDEQKSTQRIRVSPESMQLGFNYFCQDRYFEGLAIIDKVYQVVGLKGRFIIEATDNILQDWTDRNSLKHRICNLDMDSVLTYLTHFQRYYTIRGNNEGIFVCYPHKGISQGFNMKPVRLRLTYLVNDKPFDLLKSRKYGIEFTDFVRINRTHLFRLNLGIELKHIDISNIQQRFIQFMSNSHIPMRVVTYAKDKTILKDTGMHIPTASKSILDKNVEESLKAMVESFYRKHDTVYYYIDFNYACEDTLFRLYNVETRIGGYEILVMDLKTPVTNPNLKINAFYNL